MQHQHIVISYDDRYNKLQVVAISYYQLTN